MAVALTQHRNRPAVGRLQHDLLGAQRGVGAQPVSQREFFQGDLPSIHSQDAQNVHYLLDGMVRIRRPSTILSVSRLYDTGAPDLASKTTTPHRAYAHQDFQVGPGPLLVPVPLGVGNDQRCLGREHHQGVLVLARELAARFAFRHVYEPNRTPLLRMGATSREATSTGGRHSAMPSDLMYEAKSLTRIGSGTS